MREKESFGDQRDMALPLAALLAVIVPNQLDDVVKLSVVVARRNEFDELCVNRTVVARFCDKEFAHFLGPEGLFRFKLFRNGKRAAFH